VADDVLEFHAARLLLLLMLCGTKDRLQGLTKMAKLDFFVRYPQFFKEVCRHLGKDSSLPTDIVESSMVRFHYGPWDRRYYHVLAYLKAKALITVEKEGAAFIFQLTGLGRESARALSKKPAFTELVAHMRQVKDILGQKSGSALKKLVYQVFEDEIGEAKLGEVIK